jgi:hypothetical protein
MRVNPSRTKILIIVSPILIALAVGAIHLLRDVGLRSIPPNEPVFEGDSRKLKATEVVPTLDSPIKKELNAIWCSSFLSAWKVLETDLAKESISVEGNPGIALALNKAADPRPYIPEQNLYVAAGWNQKGITDQIRSEFAQKFPTKVPPSFPGMLSNSFVAYAYLEANLKFTLPYFQNREPLVFTDLSGKKTKLSSFGIRPKDDYAYFKLRRQSAILYESRDDAYKLKECVLDLDRSSQPNQIVLALIEPKSTLAEIVKSVEQKIASPQRKRQTEGLGPNDVLLVPDIVWFISHHFTELEGKRFTNPKLKGQRIDVAQQDIQFRLNRSGAELRSEAKTVMLPIPTYYVFNRPFLLYIKKRGAGMPYLVMWIENAELLDKWQPKGQPQAVAADAE